MADHQQQAHLTPVLCVKIEATAQGRCKVTKALGSAFHYTGAPLPQVLPHVDRDYNSTQLTGAAMAHSVVGLP